MDQGRNDSSFYKEATNVNENEDGLYVELYTETNSFYPTKVNRRNGYGHDCRPSTVNNMTDYRDKTKVYSDGGENSIQDNINAGIPYLLSKKPIGLSDALDRTIEPYEGPPEGFDSDGFTHRTSISNSDDKCVSDDSSKSFQHNEGNHYQLYFDSMAQQYATIRQIFATYSYTKSMGVSMCDNDLGASSAEEGAFNSHVHSITKHQEDGSSAFDNDQLEPYAINDDDEIHDYMHSNLGGTPFSSMLHRVDGDTATSIYKSVSGDAGFCQNSKDWDFEWLGRAICLQRRVDKPIVIKHKSGIYSLTSKPLTYRMLQNNPNCSLDDDDYHNLEDGYPQQHYMSQLKQLTQDEIERLGQKYMYIHKQISEDLSSSNDGYDSCDDQSDFEPNDIMEAPDSYQYG